MSKKHYGRESRGDLEPGRVPGSTKPTTNIIYGKIPDFPILNYGANGTSNFFEFRRPFILYAFKKYKDMAKTFDDDSEGLYFPPAVEAPKMLKRPLIPDLDQNGNQRLDDDGDPIMVEDMREDLDLNPLSLANDPFGMARMALSEQVKNYHKTVSRYREDYKGLFYDLWGNMSTESKAKVQEMEGFTLDGGCDAFDLWTAMLRTHRGSGIQPTFDKLKARREYSEIKQYENESIINFKERFEFALEGLRTSGSHVPNGEEQSMDFISKLNDDYYEYKITLENDIQRNIVQPPSNITEAYKQ
eukprot:gene36585-47673_t